VNVPSETRTALELVDALRTELGSARFAFPAPASRGAEERRAAALAHLDHEAAPALRRFGEVAVVGLVGGTGTGKSTLANTLAGRALSPAGPLRPTTRRPRLLASPATAAMLGCHPALAAAEPVLDPAVPPGRAYLDCGDPFAAGNDPAEAQPEAPVSAWLVVTSALRYGDALLWDLLQGIGREGVPVALVVGRLPPGSWDEIRPDLARRLEALALGYVAQLPVAELETAGDALPADGIGRVEAWLDRLFPQPGESAPRDPRPALRYLGQVAQQLSTDLAVHGQTVALLREATEAALASLGARAAAGIPSQAPPSAAEAWHGLVAPGRPLADVAPVAASAEQRERWGRGLAALGRAVHDSASLLAGAVSAGARVALADVWRGPTVPTGSRELLGAAGLDGPVGGGEAGNAAAAKRLGESLEEALAGEGASALRRAAEALTQSGLIALVQAAALGVPGARQTLDGLAPAETGAVVGLARTALGEELEGVARAAAGPFVDALTAVSGSGPRPAAWLADRLAAAAARGEG
jgi:energy-coupling factor transporter ATP-binding protein EcfA2